MEKIKKGIALFGCLILGAIVFTNTSLEAKNSNDNNGKAEYAQDEIIVKFKNDNEKPFRVIKIQEGKVEENVKAYKSKSYVVYAEPNYILYAFDEPATPPIDPLYAGWQWALNNTGQSQPPFFDKGTLGADINWEPAWENFNTDSFSETIIAILDSGIDASHPDLDDKLIEGKNFTTGRTNDTNDVYGHGTHVAGIAAAETNNSVGNTGGIAGVAFPDNIEIMPVKVLNRFGSSVSTSVADGIYYAANNGAKVINLSLGGTYPSETLENAVDYAWGKGVLIAASAGNDGYEVKRYPASFSNVMSVAATDWKDNRASFSTFNDEIDISAPGVNVLSTVIYHADENQYEYGLGTGTSMSCPHVAGLAGLLFAQDSSRSNADVRAIIQETADNLGADGWDKYFGHGKINVHAALTYSPCLSSNDCESGKICCDGKCIVPVCSVDSHCDDGESCTADACIDSGCGCENVWPVCGGEKDGCCGPTCTCKTDIDCCYCGDGIMSEGEECDGTEGVPEHYTCTEQCTLEYIPYCGDGNIDDGEECDGEISEVVTCETLGYDGGNLVCTADCVYDETGCTSDCSACHKGICDGRCHPREEDTDCPDCPQ